MSLFEWLGESANPGSMGEVTFGGRPRPPKPRGVAIACFVFSLLLLAVPLYFILQALYPFNWRELAIVAAVTGLYLLLAYTVHPRADTSNIGWLGGLFDHPFRYSDDVNRFLIFLQIILLPGRFVAESFMDFALLLTHSV